MIEHLNLDQRLFNKHSLLILYNNDSSLQHLKLAFINPTKVYNNCYKFNLRMLLHENSKNFQMIPSQISYINDLVITRR